MTGARPVTAAASLAVRLSFVVLCSSLSAHSARPAPSDQTESQALRNSILISQQGRFMLLTQEFYTWAGTKDRQARALQQMNPFTAPETNHRIGGLKLLHDVPSGPNPISQDYPNNLDGMEGDKRFPPPASP